VNSRVLAAAVLVTAAAVMSIPVAAEDSLVLDVPFVPQGEALCGGAAAAMVLRYWGERGIDAADFASLVEDSLGGIRTARLVADLQNRGWEAIALAGDEAMIRHHLARGRPVIALLLDRPGRYHYVVVVAWKDGVVLLHDPARTPFRVVSAREFDRAWIAAGRWSMLILPGSEARHARGGDDSTRVTALLGVPSAPNPFAAPPDSITPRRGDFASLVANGVRLGRGGDLEGALAPLQAATALWPDSATAWRELAGIRFHQKKWSEAASLAGRATRLDPADVLAWRLLGASLFLDGRTEDALDAWNRLGEPHLDLTRIEGLTRTRFVIVSDRMGLDSGSLLTARSFRRAQRRLSDIPVIEASRLDCHPLPGGIAEIETAVLERPVFLSGPADAVAIALRSLVDRELALSIAGLTGNGERWEAAWRWEENRPRQRIGVSGPNVAGLPGIVGVVGFRERQTYAANLVAPRGAGRRTLPPGTDSTSAGMIREVRRSAGVSWNEWLSGDLRLEADVGLEQWEAGNSRFLSTGLALDVRPFNTVALRVQGARWFALRGGRPFVVCAADAAWRTAISGIQHAIVESRIAYRFAEEGAPPALWPGAGTGRGRADLLRAHPLLEDGVIQGATFGRSLWSAGFEMDYLPWRLGPIRMGMACFVDAAKSGNLPQGRPAVPAMVDAGAGIRLAGLGSAGNLSLDAGYGLTDGASALSLVWRTGGP
jgi:peptidase C39-like protein/tetratricopeptide repeat protein